MTNEQSKEKRQQWIIDYLYGELSAEEKKIFEESLGRDTQLKDLYEQHTSLDSLIPKGTKPLIDDARMQGVRWSAFRALRAPQKTSAWQGFKNFWQIQISLKSQALAMGLMFGLGFLISSVLINPATSPEVINENISASPTAAESSAADSETENSVLDLLNESNYQVVDLNLDRYDASKGEVEFSFGLSSQSSIKGNLNDPKIRNLLLRSFNGDAQDEVRLQLTSVLSGYHQSQDVQDTLINTLLTDPNPGVRYNAVESLVKVAERPKVRMALLSALAHDVNPGIRVEAFLATSDKIDDAFLQVLRNFSIDDANTFIRERSKRILREQEDASVNVDHSINKITKAKAI